MPVYGDIMEPLNYECNGISLICPKNSKQFEKKHKEVRKKGKIEYF
jgi:hypothetical protein